MTTIDNIKVYLKKRGIKPSYQRMKIYEYLVTHKNHPTVDMIYRDLVDQIPTLSKTTVYNTLKLFVQRNISIIINIEDNETRYDADTSLHGHFKCRVCRRIYDINLDLSEVKMKTMKGFNVDEHHIYLKGTCNKCKN